MRQPGIILGMRPANVSQCTQNEPWPTADVNIINMTSFDQVLYKKITTKLIIDKCSINLHLTKWDLIFELVDVLCYH